MFWKKTTLLLLGLLAISVLLTILSLSGCFGDRQLVREKDELVARFQAQIRTLEEKQRQFRESLAGLEERLATYAATHAWAREELDRIMAEYRVLKQE